MLGYSRIQIMGNVGTMPTRYRLPSGEPVVNFSVAVNRRYKDRDGNRQESTDWYRLCCFNGLGDLCVDHLKVGDACFAEGRLRVRMFDAKNGPQLVVEIIPTTIRLLGSSRGNAGRAPDDETVPPGVDREVDDDSIPF